MRRVLTGLVLAAAAGCSNAPIAGSLDAIWPTQPAGGGPPPTDRGPAVPDVRPPGPGAPAPRTGPAPSDALPPPADIIPSGGGAKG